MKIKHNDNKAILIISQFLHLRHTCILEKHAFLQIHKNYLPQSLKKCGEKYSEAKDYSVLE